MSVLMEQHQARRARLGFPVSAGKINMTAIGRRLKAPAVIAVVAEVTPAVERKVDRTPFGAPFNFLKRPSAEAIVRLVALKHGLNYYDILGRSRTKPVVRARREAVHLVRSHCRYMSAMQLGRLFHRDHSSILSLLGQRKKAGIYQNSTSEARTYRETGPSVRKSPDLFAEQKHGVFMEDHLSNGRVV